MRTANVRRLCVAVGCAVVAGLCQANAGAVGREARAATTGKGRTQAVPVKPEYNVPPGARDPFQLPVDPKVEEAARQAMMSLDVQSVTVAADGRILAEIGGRQYGVGAVIKTTYETVTYDVRVEKATSDPEAVTLRCNGYTHEAKPPPVEDRVLARVNVQSVMGPATGPFSVLVDGKLYRAGEKLPVFCKGKSYAVEVLEIRGGNTAGVTFRLNGREYPKRVGKSRK